MLRVIPTFTGLIGLRPVYINIQCFSAPSRFDKSLTLSLASLPI